MEDEGGGEVFDEEQLKIITSEKCPEERRARKGNVEEDTGNLSRASANLHPRSRSVDFNNTCDHIC